ncbi:hypothetical protein [Gluconobacter sphaericus]|uniref:hypothetical protein n=1 Tax=Gluconobacter sphaericus TaxID=574987 RepID=UPI00312BA860
MMGFLVVPGCVKATGDIQQESQRMLRDHAGIGSSAVQSGILRSFRRSIGK